jgi:hypothetical protein
MKKALENPLVNESIKRIIKELDGELLLFIIVDSLRG